MAQHFSLSFDKEPITLLPRHSLEDRIIRHFSAGRREPLVLSGVAGSGKSVLLARIGSCFAQRPDWDVFVWPSERDLFQLLDQESFAGKSILVLIDDVANTSAVRRFLNQFQKCAAGHGLFLLMAGSGPQVDLLEKAMGTFFLDCLNMELEPLNEQLICGSYQRIFGIPHQQAQNLAALTAGYPYAYQALGFLYESDPENEEMLVLNLDALLQESVYDQMWQHLSTKDQQVLLAMAQLESSTVNDIRQAADMNSSLFSTYRRRLMKKGLIHAPRYGHLVFSLPRFREFVQMMG